jgi:hypothetical protein
MGLTKSQRRRKWLMAGLDEDMEYFYGTEEVRKKIEDKWNKHNK